MEIHLNTVKSNERKQWERDVYMSGKSGIVEDGSPGEDSNRDWVIGDGVVGESSQKKVDNERENRQDKTKQTNPFHTRLQEHFTFPLHLSLSLD